MSVYEPACQQVQRAHEASSLRGVHVKPDLLSRSLFSHHQEILQETKAGMGP